MIKWCPECASQGKIYYINAYAFDVRGIRLACRSHLLFKVLLLHYGMNFIVHCVMHLLYLLYPV